jgi:hypothetical protein
MPSKVKTCMAEHRATPVNPVSCYENHEPVNLNGIFERIYITNPLYKGTLLALGNPKL